MANGRRNRLFYLDYLDHHLDPGFLNDLLSLHSQAITEVLDLGRCIHSLGDLGLKN